MRSEWRGRERFTLVRGTVMPGLAPVDAGPADMLAARPGPAPGRWPLAAA
jgi:hypothetical protein